MPREAELRPSRVLEKVRANQPALGIALHLIDPCARLIFHGCDIGCVENGLDQLQANFSKGLGLRFSRSGLSGSKSYLEGK
jgi:hypothetical protein